MIRKARGTLAEAEQSILEVKEKPYKCVVMYHSGESMIGGIPSHKEDHGELKKLVQDSAKKVGVEIFNVDFQGMHLSKRRVNYLLILFLLMKKQVQ